MLHSRLLIAALILAGSGQVSATWSIVAVDPETGRVGLAAATCGPGVHFIAELVPGKGAVVAQAATSFKGRDKAREWIEDGVAASEILDRLADPAMYDGWFDPKFSDLQYGVATLGARPDAGSVAGGDLLPWSGDLSTLSVSVQGNTLRGKRVIDAAMSAFHEPDISVCEPSLAGRLLAALEAGRDAGGDSRCPESRSAQSAILWVAGTEEGDDSQVRLVTPKEISLWEGLYYSVFEFEPDDDEPEPIADLWRRLEASGGSACENL